jgi:hypothetical protein
MTDTKHEIMIYDGRDLIGRVAGAGKSWRAFDARGSALPGEFKTSKAAVAAINEFVPLRSCVGDTLARMDNTE